MADLLKKSWTGTLKLGFVMQPVAVYSAADAKAKTVAFNQLHATCGGRLGQQVICRTCGEQHAVPATDVKRGFEHSKGQYVVISDDELDSCKVENTKVIELKEFVPVTELSPLMIAESAFIAPVDPAMGEAYVLIREALQGFVGIGTLCHSNKEKLVAVVALGDGLVLHTLRHASEVRDVKKVPTLDKLPKVADAKTVKMMRTLMVSMQSPTLELEKYPNRYVDNVQAVIRAKVEAKENGTEAVVPVAAKVAKPVADLAAMLEASLAAKKLEVL